jgi:hypothetical protein
LRVVGGLKGGDMEVLMEVVAMKIDSVIQVSMNLGVVDSHHLFVKVMDMLTPMNGVAVMVKHLVGNQ